MTFRSLIAPSGFLETRFKKPHVHVYKVIYIYGTNISRPEMETNLTGVFNRVNQNHEVISVVRNESQSVVILDANEYNSLMETLYLLQNPANAERLRKGIEQHRQGQYKEIDVTAYLDKASALESKASALAKESKASTLEFGSRPNFS